MNIKQITDEAEKSITEDMQKAIDAKDQWQVRIPLYLITDWHRSPISDSH
ncbi:TPA: hypothetical protein J1413_004838, partial [Escherichia coli]|nr:hypothetical protein [Escherichia coli]HBA9522999.1 hypothetical protein [Escherichia coli]HBA9550967.1 hypothetical protein [Escherichia coli]HBA9560423.1 hypothetical protein [Escherichia coli]